MLWIPYIIFKNTDSDEAVTLDGELRTLVAVTREGGFVRSGPEVADEVLIYVSVYTVTLKNILQIEIFRGEENMITMNQTHDKKFHCTYLIHYYPFDTQVPLHITGMTIFTNEALILFRSAKLTCSWSGLPVTMFRLSPTPWSC